MNNFKCIHLLPNDNHEREMLPAFFNFVYVNLIIKCCNFIHFMILSV